jgi:hypothetical protein
VSSAQVGLGYVRSSRFCLTIDEGRLARHGSRVYIYIYMEHLNQAVRHASSNIYIYIYIYIYICLC